MDRLGIEMLSVFGMPPIEFVHLTADLGCRYITTSMVGLEIPMRARAEAGVNAYDRLMPCVNSARSLLARASEKH